VVVEFLGGVISSLQQGILELLTFSFCGKTFPKQIKPKNGFVMGLLVFKGLVFAVSNQEYQNC